MFEVGYEAMLIVLDPGRLVWLVFGATVGLVVGVLPGLGGTVGMAILLPFVFGMDPYSGIAMLVGMAAVVHTGDTFPSVLLGIPGSSGSQATIMDGYPLAQKGEAGRALGAAFFVSMIGGLIGAITLFSIVGIARPLILALGPAELFMFAVLGLSMVGVLARGASSAGFVSGLLGMLIGIIGLAPMASQFRFDYGSLYLFDGIPIAVVALGLFALPEMIDLVVANRAISQTTELKSDRMRGIRDVVTKNKVLVLRNSMLGTGLGMVPGVGGSVVDWLAYGITKQTVKDNENFGKGDIRGVIGPESANNAKEGGALIPTLLFGIPGSGTTAMLLGGLLLLGIEPGPSMVSANLDKTLSIAWSLAIANVIGTMACLGLSKQVSRLSLIPAKILTPFLLVIMTVAAYQATRNWGDLIAFLIIGVIGWLMKQVGFPRPPMLIGFVLAVSAERYLHLSMSFYGTSWFTRPIVMILFVAIVLILFGASIRDFRKRSMQRRTESSVTKSEGEA